jgi:Sec-independent protein translocase protein TatA
MLDSPSRLRTAMRSLHDLWTLFKSSGGRSKDDDESTPDESEQKEALQIVWHSLERAASRRAEDVRAVPAAWVGPVLDCSEATTLAYQSSGV